MTSNFPDEFAVRRRINDGRLELQVDTNPSASTATATLDDRAALDLADEILEHLEVDLPRLETGLWVKDESGRYHASVDFDGYDHTAACGVVLEEIVDSFGIPSFKEAEALPTVERANLCRECLLEAPVDEGGRQ